MHAPRSYGLFSLDELSAEDRQAVERLARQLTNFKTVSHLPSLKRSVTLSDGRVATAIDMGGIFKVLVSDRDALPERVFDGLAHDFVPMWFSGVIENALPETNQGVALKLTEWTRRRLVGYAADVALPSKEQQLLRFEVDYPLHLAHLKLKYSGIYHDTQYFKMRPTWYSGAMEEVVQAVLGFGRQDFDALPDNKLERAVFSLPENVLQQVNDELRGFRLPAYSGFVAESGQLQYGYVARECEGVGFGVDGMAWLLRLNSWGVFAMPLPLIPATTTRAFRVYMEEVGDVEVLHLLNRFGGVPSGETFPKDADFSVWQRAGVIVKICDSDFFQFSPMYEAGGFAFNSRGDEGFNTCFEYDESGMMWVYGYKMRLKLASCESRLGYAADNRDTWGDLSADDVRLLNAYLGTLLAAVDLSAVGLAIRYKIRRASVGDLLRRAALGNGAEQEKEYWDTLEMSPIAAHSGSLNRVTSGRLYANTMYVKAIAGLKFPTLDAQGCASFAHDMEDFIRKGGVPPKKCDTVVFGCYVGDMLRTVHYFYDERKFQQSEVSTFEEPMIIGQWERTVTTGQSGLVGQFYTTDWDDRTEIAPTMTHEVVTGRDLGYGQPEYHTPPLLYRVGTVKRSRYYSSTTEKTVETGKSLAVAVCVPVYGRDCIEYAKKEGVETWTWEEMAVRNSMSDPTSYQMWTHDSVFHFRGATKEGNKGEPRPKDGKPVFVDSEIYAPYPFSDYADSGSWHGVIADITGIVGQYTARGATKHAGGVVVGGEAPRFDEYHKKDRKVGVVSGCLNVAIQGVGAVRVHDVLPHNWFFEVSPVQNGADWSYFWRDCCVNVNGVAYANIDEKKQKERRYSWGESGLVDSTAAHGLIGVIYE
ncbi:hypothetical protein [Wielerella bovis]|uniref:hypothetical protein n=1 Tax=Wielerella bovis TaxID=2917790 RepID=UPI00201A156E|nr:hypothetical protein [Wielerella bovis]ULJ66640.1 hypothetical protein MIS31_10385 [Wielerella bovis]